MALNVQGGGGSGACAFGGSAQLMRLGGEIDPAESPGTVLTGPAELLTNVRGISTLQQQRIQAFRAGAEGGASSLGQGVLLSSGSGLAAGALFGMPVGAWLSYSRSDFEDDFARTVFDASRDMVLGGVDLSPREDVVAGLSLGWQSTQATTAFNGGQVDSEGITVSPYFAVLFAEFFSLEASFGYTSLETDQFRTAPVTGARVDSSVDSDRWFWTANLNAGQQFGPLYLAGRVGVLNAREYQDGFTESDGSLVGDRSVKLGQWRLGGDVSYLVGAFEPYATLTYERDFSRTELTLTAGPQPANDRDGVLAGLGVRWYGPAGFTGSFEWLSVQGREDYDEDTFNLLLRGEF